MFTETERKVLELFWVEAIEKVLTVLFKDRDKIKYGSQIIVRTSSDLNLNPDLKFGRIERNKVIGRSEGKNLKIWHELYNKGAFLVSYPVVLERRLPQFVLKCTVSFYEIYNAAQIILNDNPSYSLCSTVERSKYIIEELLRKYPYQSLK